MWELPPERDNDLKSTINYSYLIDHSKLLNPVSFSIGIEIEFDKARSVFTVSFADTLWGSPYSIFRPVNFSYFDVACLAWAAISWCSVSYHVPSRRIVPPHSVCFKSGPNIFSMATEQEVTRANEEKLPDPCEIFYGSDRGEPKRMLHVSVHNLIRFRLPWQLQT